MAHALHFTRDGWDDASFKSVSLVTKDINEKAMSGLKKKENKHFS
jgi:hypothetical protein